MTLKMTTTPPKENQEELETLFKNIHLLLDNKEKILNTKKFYSVHIQGTGISAMYIGNTRLFLGDLIRLWDNNIWREGNKYYYHVGGSPLSGMSFCKCWIEHKGFQTTKNTPSFGTLASPAWRMVQGENKNDDPKIIVMEKISRAEHKSTLTITDLVKILSKNTP